MPSETVPFIVAIPARYASTRLPGKPLRRLGDRPLIAHVAARALAAGAREVVVATDDQRIADALADVPVTVCMTDPALASGSDRIAACAAALGWDDDDIVVNLQGDEPFAPVGGIRAAVEALAQSDAPMATLAVALDDVEALLDPNCVKLVRAADGRALYFSRAPIPWPRDAFASHRNALPYGVPFLRHIGLYAYRAGFLRQFARLAPTPLERAESLEQLRALEHGHAIQVALTPEPFPPGIDTEDDLRRAEQYLQEVSS
ncbi:3-deoxy-manno-octulosonate cytidylyltransferase [Oleiagrimonas soli]|uniref:3-deoxy-manno-octulosonate cytidylyltransferase n=1 Tax=Oleiagrimonas soli TaxID=1543381 RepID=A0A099CXJ2_9GAMM|nr:3-deoxy-manno-octulosonate cytidylyltransferase [Oleiagrimonas soli]KGI78337.1 3-deoxy-manno-octulosonate cytidylyltransferase [Oleiagrimonas soli]MBB6183165.1 3-deoxy-manno-octulosonate cytidylyltransferase (CMP-KDO synthetase) [Oleiagrimonas soli]